LHAPSNRGTANSPDRLWRSNYAIENSAEAKKSGAVSEDRAAPHENPNLTLSDETKNGRVSFKRWGKKSLEAATSLFCCRGAYRFFRAKSGFAGSRTKEKAVLALMAESGGI